MVLLSTPKSGGLAAAPPTAVPHLVAAGGILGVLFMFRTWTLHILDMILAWSRGLPALREKNVYLKGAMICSYQNHFTYCLQQLCLVLSVVRTEKVMGLMDAGLYAPTSEEHFDDDLPVHGDMPASMNGVYVRVGPVRLKSKYENVEHCACLT
jgi:hypothetical protein